jgi:hypothetical protein
MLLPCAAAAAPARLACRRQRLPGASCGAWLPAVRRRHGMAGRPAGVVRVLAATPSTAVPAPDPDPQRFTNLNKPVMRLKQTIPYGQFLNDVRSQSVKEVVLTHEGTDRACVVYKDGSVRYVQFPADDARVADVMSTYGVVASLAVNEPMPLDTSETLRYKDLAMYWIPGLLIGVIYLIVNGLARKKGDYEVRPAGRAAALAYRTRRRRMRNVLTLARCHALRRTGPREAAQAGRGGAPRAQEAQRAGVRGGAQG